ncbi:hypothetical protein QQ008_25460 [Fulvivirgaceae bacterium BMA10]|uniref:Periplasmic heavy metal sensor n=1 Tax=Splendidivirga corallicola TaxID=3051826 RepID=A0ABT8KWJ1_9BACT|nr:hypothetical protein [Fulvivirgaceae bacterium BMA10]
MKTQSLKVKHLLVVMTMILISIPGFSQEKEKAERRQKGREHRAHMEMRHKRAEIPNLSDKQKEDIKKIRLAFHEDVLPLKNQIGEKQARLRTLTTEKNVNMGQVNKVIEEIGAIKTDLHKKEVAMKQDIRKLLDDEQRLYFDTHRNQMKRRFHRGQMRKG